jgi:hypothetical protein
VLAGIGAVGDAETKVKLEGLEQAILKVVALDHLEVLNRLVTDAP